MTLLHLGWTPALAEAFIPHRERGEIPARVAREHRDRYVLLDGSGEHPGELSGRLRHETLDRSALPAVGDWVAVRHAGGASYVVTAVLPRTSAFIRHAAGDPSVPQVLAANVDTVLLVCGLDGDLNLRRIERYLTAAWESGAEAVIVLNKTDLADDLPARRAEVEAAASGVPVVALAARDGAGLDALAPWLTPGRTLALLGSSGVGKSTLVNALLGAERMPTNAVRESDSRGRHTTTHRELVPLPGGAMLIDTPGLRLLRLWGDEAGPDAAFPDIVALAEGCRFRDCGHAGEPGCAVSAALERGELDAERLESWRKLGRELRWLASRGDPVARAEEQAKWKAIHKSMKHHPKASRWRQH